MTDTLTYTDSVQDAAQRIQRIGHTTIDGVNVVRYICVLSSDKPQDMLIRTIKLNDELYKANRDLCRADYAAFEDEAYKLQDEYLAKLVVEETSEEMPEDIVADVTEEIPQE